MMFARGIGAIIDNVSLYNASNYVTIYFYSVSSFSSISLTE